MKNVEFNASQSYRLRSRRGISAHVLGADLKIKISSRDRNGAFAVFEGRTLPLEGPLLHRHTGQDEYWFIVESEYRFEVDGREIYASAGATVFAPRGSSHTFQNIGTDPGWTITTVVPGGVDLFFEEIAALSPKLHSVFQKPNQELLGPPVSVRSEIAAAVIG
jgi:mannose-6-phosphate isomerase-like protein (cupin superfamily)